MNTSKEERELMVGLALKSLFKVTVGQIPVAGTLLTDVLFEYRPKLKMERLVRFMELLRDEFSKFSIQNIETIKSEEFSDLFENILGKVASTRQKKKITAFKNVLIHGIQNKKDIENCEIFSEILNDLTEGDVDVLFWHNYYLYNGKSPFSKKRELEIELEIIEKNKEIKRYRNYHTVTEYSMSPRSEEEILKELEGVKRKIAEYRSRFGPHSSSYFTGNYKYSIQNLFAKGLLVDEGVGSIGTMPFELMAITDFGVHFLDYIKYSSVV